MSAHLLISCRQMQADLPRHHARLERLGVTWECPPVQQQLSEAELLEMIARFDGVVAGDDEVTAEVLERGLPRLKVVSKWGVGVDSIDREAAARLGIAVTNTPGVFDDEVADVVIGYLVLLLRGLHLIDRAIRDGGWLKIEGRSTASLSIGLVGVGGIGLAVARRAHVLGMRVLGTDTVDAAAAAAEAAGVAMTSLESVLEGSDVISLNCPLTTETYHLMGARGFGLMRQGSYLINTSRGRIVDQRALVDALASGRLAGAALDVFEEEPLPADDQIRSFPNVILGSHNASNTHEAVRRVSERALDNALSELRLL